MTSVVKRFPEPVEVITFLRQGVEIWVLFGAKSLKFIDCPVDIFSEVFLEEAAC